MNMTVNGIRSQGEITRVVNDYVAYIYDDVAGETFSFTPAVVTDYHGESFRELHIVEGQRVEFVRRANDATISHVVRPRRTLVSEDSRSDDYIPGKPDPRKAKKDPQIELQDDDIQGEIACHRAIPPETRKFGRLLNTQLLRAGDLMLTREKTLDALSSEIAHVQNAGGYALEDARWTHAALYLGDDAHVVEATVDGNGANVRMTSLDDYCQGLSILRFRRPHHLATDRDAWRFCIRALSRLRQSYSIAEAARIWFKVVVHGLGFYDNPLRRPATNKAILCSTFYSDAFNEATGRRLSEMNGAVVPAWLSVSDQFDEIQTHWLKIV